MLRYCFSDTFFFYHNCFHIPYNCFSKTYLLLLAYYYHLFFKKVPYIPNNSVFNCFIFFFSLKRFLMFLMMLSSSDCLFLLPSLFAEIFRCASFKTTNNSVLKTTYSFSNGLRNIIINQSHQISLIGFFFFISFYSNLSISSVETIIGLKNSSSISFF